jgi:hypothetical protein
MANRVKRAQRHGLAQLRHRSQIALMRTAIALCLMVSPAFAGEWTKYENPRYGFALDVPVDGWTIQPEPENGDGRAWYSNDGRSTIRAWGSNILEGLESDAAERVASDKESGWTITSELNFNMDLSKGPEGWHLYNGSLDGRLFSQKSIPTCNGTQAIYVRLEYFESQMVEFLPVVEQLMTSLKPAPGDGCSTN